jgi:hypothetical protein
MKELIFKLVNSTKRFLLYFRHAQTEHVVQNAVTI